MSFKQIFSSSTKVKIIVISILLSILFGLWYFFFETNYFGRKISRATGGIVAAEYEAPTRARAVLSVSVNQDKSGDSAKNITYLMEDCTVVVYEYRDGVRGMVLDSRMRIKQNGKNFRQHDCVPETN